MWRYVPDLAETRPLSDRGGAARPASAAALSRIGDEAYLLRMASMLERLRDAMNSHDAKEMASLFADTYQSSQPLHPARGFSGHAQVLKNWMSVFEGVPDFSAELVASAVDGAIVVGRVGLARPAHRWFSVCHARRDHPPRPRRLDRRNALCTWNQSMSAATISTPQFASCTRRPLRAPADPSRAITVAVPVPRSDVDDGALADPSASTEGEPERVDVLTRHSGPSGPRRRDLRMPTPTSSAAPNASGYLPLNSGENSSQIRDCGAT